jgi:hypothetical protein
MTVFSLKKMLLLKAPKTPENKTIKKYLAQTRIDRHQYPAATHRQSSKLLDRMVEQEKK